MSANVTIKITIAVECSTLFNLINSLTIIILLALNNNNNNVINYYTML